MTIKATVTPPTENAEMLAKPFQCSHCDQPRHGRCSYADCPWEIDQASVFIRALTAERDQALAECERLRAALRAVLTPAALDVLTERQRQVEGEGWTPEHDDTHANGEMAGAAACYALTGVSGWAPERAILRFWPWALKWWKPSTPRRDMVKAAALAIAEIERLDRAALAERGKQP